MQQFIPGTEPPDRIPEIEEAIDAWLESKIEQRRASDSTKLAHAVLAQRVTEAGVERYAYTDRTTGKRRFVYPDRTPKMKTAALRVSRHDRRERDDEPEVGEEVTPPADDKVESRRVSRASVADEIDADPFASTRSAMNGGILEQAEAVRRAAGADAVTVEVGGEVIPLAEGRKRKAKDKKKRGKR